MRSCGVSLQMFFEWKKKKVAAAVQVQGLKREGKDKATVEGLLCECGRCMSTERWYNLSFPSFRLPSQQNDSPSHRQRRGSPVSSEERLRRDKQHLDDITAARLLPLHHLPAQLLSIEESLALQQQQKQSYEVFKSITCLLSVCWMLLIVSQILLQGGWDL